MSFTLYDYVLSGSCYKVRLMAGLLGVEYETVAVDFHPGEAHRSSAMLELNPSGTLPVLVSGDLVLTETGAMLAYLAARHDPGRRWWPREDPATAATVMEWVGFAPVLTATAGKARLGALLGRPVDMAAARAGAHEALRRLEAHLTERVFDGGTWIAGDHPTIADITCFAYVALAPDAGIEHDPYPAIRNWLHAVKALPGFVDMPGIHVRHDLRGEAAHG